MCLIIFMTRQYSRQEVAWAEYELPVQPQPEEPLILDEVTK